ncbi:DegT/DnrJ/EryC1/StrS family aminotransferase [Miniphocaeibacter halophilus]|uniref:DegT/DnrJ/EryC1/StrS family aminotransferase n=1 Tax=Miniphocaeibacter halophilus TaxID=2931922 RepID=A0AC61MQT5_9FIRM|nr:DegT/DnrJ/EryC1/StrS family aminotransferase [Miniphocaeibacter halophilus]QQK07930.1 DegT/DnrJ/EryC1/StrS family aminotransferase [Miniphocaeibacter halophilus]
MNIPFSPPDITQLEIDEVVDTLKSGWITTGNKTKKLEKLITDYINVDGTICLNSATAAMETALRFLGIGEGDEVITSAYTYTASASVIDHVGAKIVLVDTLEDSFMMDYNKLNSLINEKTKAIIPVDIAGVPVDYDKLKEIILNNKDKFKPNSEIQKLIGRIAIVSDNAHSLGSTYKNRKTGEDSDFSNFSFHAVKNFTTGEGGALSWKSIDGISDEEIYKRLQLLTLHGQNKDALSKTKLGSWEYDIIGLNYKYNMPDITAAIGLAQFKRYDGLLKRRKEIIKYYDDSFKNTSIEPLKHCSDKYNSNGHLYLTRVKGIAETERNKIIEKLAERGIASNVHYKPLPMLTAYKNLGFKIEDFPNAYNQYKNEITLPLHTLLSDEEVEYIVDNYKEIVNELTR